MQLLVIELYKWMGDIIKEQLEGKGTSALESCVGLSPASLIAVKPAQLKELEAEFAKITPGQARPTRHLRSGKGAGGGGKKGKKGKGGWRHGALGVSCCVEVACALTAESKEEEFDPLSLVEARDIGAELPKSWEQKVQAKKWKDKKVTSTFL